MTNSSIVGQHGSYSSQSRQTNFADSSANYHDYLSTSHCILDLFSSEIGMPYDAFQHRVNELGSAYFHFRTTFLQPGQRRDEQQQGLLVSEKTSLFLREKFLSTREETVNGVSHATRYVAACLLTTVFGCQFCGRYN
jgi:hypothetical protein